MSDEPPGGTGQPPRGPGLSAEGAQRWRLSRATINLTAAGALFSALGLVTGPLLARALEPAGRGELAAILVPLTLAPWIAVLAQDDFAAREAARGKRVGTIALTLGPLVVVLGLVVALAGLPISSAFAGGSSVVRGFLLVGFAMMPVLLVGLLLVGINQGLERWRSVIIARIVPGVMVLVGIIVLFIADSLTVASAAAVHIAAALSVVVCVAPVLRHRRFAFDPRLLREAVPFGAKAAVGTTAELGNARLDQLLMITLVAPSELGLYAVAVNLSSFGTVLAGGIAPPLLARISSGEIELVPRALRTMLALLAFLSLVVAILAPFLLNLLFGSEFDDAAKPAWVLLAAGLPLTGAVILTQTLYAVGRPGLPSVGQLAALAVTIPGLLLVLPEAGIVGAAVVSLVAYSLNFLILTLAVMRICDLTANEMLVPRTSDFIWLRQLVQARIRARRSATG